MFRKICNETRDCDLRCAPLHVTVKTHILSPHSQDQTVRAYLFQGSFGLQCTVELLSCELHLRLQQRWRDEHLIANMQSKEAYPKDFICLLANNLLTIDHKE